MARSFDREYTPLRKSKSTGGMNGFANWLDFLRKTLRPASSQKTA
jgi:hypothetical protein